MKTRMSADNSVNAQTGISNTNTNSPPVNAWSIFANLKIPTTPLAVKTPATKPTAKERLEEFVYTNEKRNQPSSPSESPESLSKKSCTEENCTVTPSSADVIYPSEVNIDDFAEKIDAMHKSSTKKLNDLSDILRKATKTYTGGLDSLKGEFADYKSAIDYRYKGLEKKVVNIEKKRVDSNAEMKQLIEEKFKTLEEKLSAPTTDPSSKIIIDLQRKIENMERDNRKFNLIIKGLKSSSATASADAEDFFRKAFNMTNVITETKFISLRNSADCRLCVKVNSWATKQVILKEKGKLMKSQTWAGVLVEPDLTEKEQLIAAKIRQFGRAQRKDGKTVQLGYTWAIVDNVEYFWSEVDKDIKISAKPRRTNMRNSSAKSVSAAGSTLRSSQSPYPDSKND